MQSTLRDISLRLATVVVMFFCAMAAVAQKNVPVSVKLIGACGNRNADVHIAINGDDGGLLTLYKEKDGWNGVWPRIGTDTLVTFWGTLRLGGTRTYCESATVYSDGITFLFECGDQPARKVVVNVHAARRFGYVRTLRNSKCAPEFGVSTDGAKDILDVPFQSEDLRLQLDRESANVGAPGLRVNHGCVIDHAEKGGHAELSKFAIVDAIEVQRLEGLQWSYPKLSGNAHDLDLVGLRRAGIETVSISVEK